MDKPNKEWYSICPSCEQIRTAKTQEPLIKVCAVCQREITKNDVHPFIEPLAFSVRIDEKENAARFRRSTLIRQRQTITHFIDQVESSNFQDFGLFKLALKETGTLFRYNLGPEKRGFMLCPECGCSEPLRGYKAGKPHKKLRSFTSTMQCPHLQVWHPIAYGHQFPSFCLIARPTAPHNTESLAFALQKGLCTALDIETSDIGVSWRRYANKNEKVGSEIILYDHTPGGAGFVKEGFSNWDRVLHEAKQHCADCTCEKACYDCLKNYGNQSHHERLDRNTVVQFLKGLI